MVTVMDVFLRTVDPSVEIAQVLKRMEVASGLVTVDDRSSVPVAFAVLAEASFKLRSEVLEKTVGFQITSPSSSLEKEAVSLETVLGEVG